MRDHAADSVQAQLAETGGPVGIREPHALFIGQRVRLIAGRMFDVHDVETAPNVAVVDQTLAARFWPGSSAVGRRIYRPDDPNNLVGISPTTKVFTVLLGAVAGIAIGAVI